MKDHFLTLNRCCLPSGYTWQLRYR